MKKFLPQGEEQKAKSVCCSADVDWCGGGWEGESIVDCYEVCKKCGKTCEVK